MNKTNSLKTMRMALSAVGLMAVAASSYAAGTATNTFQVSANVNAQCSVTATNMAFGDVDPLATTAVINTSSIAVKCTKNSAYNVGLNAGTTPTSTIAQRFMANGADLMEYQLYSDSGRTAVWGNSTGSWVPGVGNGMGINNPLTVYGRVPLGQSNLAVGGYSEPSVTVTVFY